MAAAAPASVDGVAALLGQAAASPYARLALKVALGLLLLVIGLRVGRWLADVTLRVLLRAHVDQILAEFLRNVAQILLLAIFVISALELTGFPTTSLLTALGAAGLAIGLALKDSLSHIAAGVVLIVLRPFRVGDSVNIAGQDGVVEGIHIFQTRMHTFDNRDIVFMNGAVIAAPIFNYSQRASRRADIALILAHDSNLERVFAVARSVVAADSRVHKDPAPALAIGDITDRGIVFTVQVWTEASAVGTIKADLLLALQQRLRDGGVEFARAYVTLKACGVMPPREQQA